MLGATRDTCQLVITSATELWPDIVCHHKETAF